MELTCVRELKAELQRRQERLKNLREVATSVTVPRLDGLPRPNNLFSKPEKFMQLIIDEERELARLQVELDETATDLSKEIKKRVDDARQETILILRYVGCLSFREVSRRTLYSVRNCLRLHNSGKSKFESRRYF